MTTNAPLPTSTQPRRPQPSRQPRKDKVSGVLIDAGLSRWLTLGNSNVTSRPNAPPLRANQLPLLSIDSTP